MTTRFVHFDVSDVRFPTSRALDGSDAMNPGPDYSAAYVVVNTSGGEKGHGFVFIVDSTLDLREVINKSGRLVWY